MDRSADNTRRSGKNVWNILGEIDGRERNNKKKNEKEKEVEKRILVKRTILMEKNQTRSIQESELRDKNNGGLKSHQLRTSSWLLSLATFHVRNRHVRILSWRYLLECRLFSTWNL